MNKVRLTVENRMLIEQLLRLNYKLKDIASIIDSSSSTISREIKKRRITGKGIFKECEKTNRYPFVCNGCSIKTYCRKKKYYYNYILYPFLSIYSTNINRYNSVFTYKIRHNNDRIVKKEKLFSIYNNCATEKSKRPQDKPAVFYRLWSNYR